MRKINERRRPASYCRFVSLRDFFLQKKRITAIKRFRLAGSIQIEFLRIASKIQLLLIAMLNGNAFKSSSMATFIKSDKNNF